MKHPPLSGRDYAAALCVVLIWGTNFVAMKYALHQLTPFQLGAGRYLFAILPLVLFVRPPRLAWKWVVLYGLFQGVGQFGLLFLSLRIGMSAALASVLLQTPGILHRRVRIRTAGRARQPRAAGRAAGRRLLACFGLNYLAPGGAESGTTAGGFLLCLAAAGMWAAWCWAT